MDESGFLARLRTSLGREEAPLGPLELEVPAETERPSSPEALAKRLARELEEVGGVVHPVSSTEDAGAAVSSILSEHAAKQVVWGETDLLRELDVGSVLKTAGMEVTVCDLRRGFSRARIRDAEFVADCGITSADYGIAETGTLALLAGPGQGRAVSLLPPMHIAVLRASDIVYDLSALFERVESERKELPSALTFITGPSRTADIELVLTVGVHGPKYLHVILLGDA
jgi:L-lactate dehydrogenase complex protein LldG